MFTLSPDKIVTGRSEHRFRRSAGLTDRTTASKVSTYYMVSSYIRKSWNEYRSVWRTIGPIA